MRAIEKLDDGDFEMFGLEVGAPEGTISIDEAVDNIFNQRKWPLLGGPSGRGWSFFSVAMRCAQLFRATYDVPAQALAERVKRLPGLPLQIGALFHTLMALYYGAGLGNATVLPDRGGLVAEAVKLPSRRRRFTVPSTAADDLIAVLKQLCESDQPSPLLDVVLEAERLFDAHTDFYGRGREDVAPLGVEVFAEHPQLGYTCRYDMIGAVGLHDPVIQTPGVFIFERKTTRWIDEKYLEGWALDGEVLGQLSCWKPSGMEAMFGPLAGIVIDVVSKGRIPECRRVILPATLPAVAQHERWVRYHNAQIHLWRAMGLYPQSYANCWGRYGRCSEFDNCVLGLTDEEKA